MRSVVFLLTFFHICIWGFVLLAFLVPKLAVVNCLYVIPLIFTLHALLPFHVLNETKRKLYPTSFNERVQSIESRLVLPRMVIELRDLFEGWQSRRPTTPSDGDSRPIAYPQELLSQVDA